MKKRILSISIIVFTLCMYMFSLTACFPTYGVEYVITRDYAMVTGFYGPAANVRIASSYQGYPVTHIAKEAFKDSDEIVSVTIPSSVTTIGERAFFSCSKLKSISIPKTVTNIGASAFEYCKIENITLPNNLRKLGDAAFKSCSQLKHITIPDSITSIGKDTFHSCFTLQTATIGEGVTSIGRNAFYQCSYLASVTFKDTSGWFRTASEKNWLNKKDGIEINLTDSSYNSTYFRSTHYNYYWYKI